MEKPKVEQYLRTADIARLWGVERATIVHVFKDRPGVIRLPKKGGKSHILLIPADQIDMDDPKNYLWSVEELAIEFKVPPRDVIALFRAEPGVFRINGVLQIPDSIRIRVLARHQNR